jgi:hypothetical protein
VKISKVRKCYGAGWVVECCEDGLNWDVALKTKEDADHLYHLLKAIQHSQKARG